MRGMMVMAAAAVLLAACELKSGDASNSAVSAPTGENPQAIVEAIEKQWATGSTESVMANYAPDAVAFMTGNVAPTADRNVLTKDTAGFMEMKPADFVVTDRHTQKLDDDTIVSSGVVSFTANVGPGRPVLRVRFTQVIQKQSDGRWLIAHEHMSLPPEPVAAPPAPAPVVQ